MPGKLCPKYTPPVYCDPSFPFPNPFATPQANCIPRPTENPERTPRPFNTPRPPKPLAASGYDALSRRLSIRMRPWER